MPIAEQIQRAITNVHDQRSFIQNLLIDTLGWQIPDGIEQIEDIAFGWTQEELGTNDLDQQLVDGQIFQIQSMIDNQPWGIFVLEFANEQVFTMGRGLTGPLRRVLRGLVPKRRRQANLLAWDRENLLFICTYNYQYFRFAYFKAPEEKAHAAPLTTFGWEPDTPARTACEFNLPFLKWPDDPSDTELWCQDWQRAFDKEKLTKTFFDEYKNIFDILQNDLISQTRNSQWAHDYALQFLNRCMFLYFVQKKQWVNNDPEFLKSFWQAYQETEHSENSFFGNWLKVMFFEAFNNKFHGGHTHFPDNIKKALQLAPYLNGGLFSENELDRKHNFSITDTRFLQILTFLDRYNFTVSEDTPLDIEVAVDAEMLGMVYESLVNISEDQDHRGDAGIFYTPRVEIDLMCRLSIVDYLTNHLGSGHKDLLYKWVFAFELNDKQQADTDIAQAGLHASIYELIDQITIVDLACGSGSFLVGMLTILDDLHQRLERLSDQPQSAYKRRREIIGQSLYGVDVKGWACHVAELRLWLALIIDAQFTPEQLHLRTEPLLPNFSFKIRQGDSLVQQIGSIDMAHRRGIRELPSAAKVELSKLKNEKIKFFNNDQNCKFKTAGDLEQQEVIVFRHILQSAIDKIDTEAKELMRQQAKDESTDFGNLLGDDILQEKDKRDKQAKMQARENQLQSLANEKAALEAVLSNLRDKTTLPFVWDIAFAEIFSGDSHGFDIVIGNPPYVRQEKIANPQLPPDSINNANKKQYKAKLATAVYKKYPKFFGYKPITETATHKINAKSDLYIYFYFNGLSLLNEKGSFCFITSNSWLDVGYGKDLQEFLLRRCNIKLVLDNKTKRSFKSADVNTVIVLFSSPADNRQADHICLEKTARFMMAYVPFEELLSADIFTQIEQVTEKQITDVYRIFPAKQEKLLLDGCEIKEKAEKKKSSGPLIKTAKYLGNKWGARYLRAPDIYWTVIEKYGDALTNLDRAVEVCRGVTTGCNEFFFLERTGEKTEEGFVHVTNGDGWAGALEKDTLQFGVQKVKECTKLIFEPKKLVFCPPDNPPHHAANYIRYGESMGYSRRSTCKARAKWWKLPTDKQNASLIGFNYNIYDTGRSYISSVRPTYYSDSFHVLRCNDPESLHAYMNSTLFHFLINVDARTVFGGGKAKLQTYELEDLYCIKKFTCIGKAEHFSTMYEKLCGREDKYLIDELTEPVRLAIDEVIFDILGLTKSERDAVYEAVIDLVESRLKKADSLR